MDTIARLIGKPRLLLALLALALAQAAGQAQAQSPSPEGPVTQPRAQNPAAEFMGTQPRAPSSAAEALGTPIDCDLCDREACCLQAPIIPWYFRSEGIALRRDVSGKVNIAARDNRTNIVLSTDDLDEPFKAGPRLTLGHTFGDGPYQIEFSYFWLADWDQSFAIRDATPNSLGGVGNLFSVYTNFGFPTPVAGFDYNRFVSIREFSRMNSGELNVMRRLFMKTNCLATTVMIGARHMQVNEEFDYHSESGVPLPLGSALTVGTRTTNDLWGAQIGALFEAYVEQRVWINLAIKGAILNNAASQNTTGTFTTAGLSQGILGGRSQNGTAYLGDLSLDLVCRVTPHFTTRIGYQSIWVNGLALGTRNFDPSPGILLLGPTQLNQGANVVYHGPHAGVELTW
jgi:hypothetical protein